MLVTGVSETPSTKIDCVTTGTEVARKLCLLPRFDAFSVFQFMTGAALLN